MLFIFCRYVLLCKLYYCVMLRKLGVSARNYSVVIFCRTETVKCDWLNVFKKGLQVVLRFSERESKRYLPQLLVDDF